MATRSSTRTHQRIQKAMTSILILSFLRTGSAIAKTRHDRRSERDARLDAGSRKGKKRNGKQGNGIIEISEEEGLVVRINTKNIRKKVDELKKGMDGWVRGNATWKSSRRSRRMETASTQTIKRISESTSKANGLFLTLAISILFLLFKDKIRWPHYLSFSNRKNLRGRVIRDRSLGGKEVYIAPLESSYRSKSAVSPLDELNKTSVGSDARRRQEKVQDFVPPTWWTEPPTSFSNAAQKQSAEMDANKLLRSMLDARLMGTDFPVFSLVEYESICSRAGVSLKIEPLNSRDALFRSGIEAAIEATIGGSSILGGKPPASFICGLAVASGMDRNRAATLIKAGVATKCRSILLNCAAQLRRGEDGDVLLNLMRIDSLLATFTPAVNAPETEVLAAGLASRISLKERQELLETYTASGFRNQHLFSELMGL